MISKKGGWPTFKNALNAYKPLPIYGKLWINNFMHTEFFTQRTTYLCEVRNVTFINANLLRIKKKLLNRFLKINFSDHL